MGPAREGMSSRVAHGLLTSVCSSCVFCRCGGVAKPSFFLSASPLDRPESGLPPPGPAEGTSFSTAVHLSIPPGQEGLGSPNCSLSLSGAGGYLTNQCFAPYLMRPNENSYSQLVSLSPHIQCVLSPPSSLSILL